MPNWCNNTLSISHDNEDLVKQVENEANKQDPRVFTLLKPDKEWGTKWEADILSVERDGNHIYMVFNTAWGPPIELYTHMEKTGWTIHEGMYEEPGTCFVGNYSNGENEYYEYDLRNEDWRDTIPEELIEFADIEERFEEAQELAEELADED